nr:hypothetical protein [Tanacetum cinerariifolium]
MDVSKDSTNKDYISSVLESVKANSLASKISNIDGKFLPRRYTTYQEPLKDAGSSKSNISNVKDKVDTIRKPSFASVVHEKPQKTIIKIKEMRNEVSVNGAAVTIPMDAVESVNARFVNTLYGYFIGDRLAFPLVENYVKNTWAKSAYARVLIEIAADVELVKSLIIAIPVGNKEGQTFATIDIRYEWTPPRCASCRIFDHVSEKCPKLPKVASNEKVIEEGFIEVKKKKTKTKKRINNVVANNESTNRGPIQITTNNSFSALSEETDTNLKDKERVNADYQTPIESQFVNDSDEDVDEYNTMEETLKTVHKVVIYDNKLSVCAILKSYVATRNLERLCKHVFKNQNWISNAMSCLKGTRIIIGWNQNDVDVAVIHQDPQVIHTCIWIKADRKEFFCSFVYAFNKYIHRRPLWNGLCLHKNYINNMPWCLLGDFNALLFLEDTSMGSSSLDVTMREFKECVKNMEVMDVQRTGLQYTWNQKPMGKDGILRKLDEELDKMQTDLDNDPSNLSLQEKEAVMVADFNEALLMEEKVSRCSFKVDIQKAYDTVDWDFLRGKRGLRQGNPLSPYLFTLIMEVFTLMLKRRVSETSTFTHHRFCSELDLINLCFADDLFLFSHVDVNSAKVIKDALDDFKDASGLNPSMPKSKAYFCNVINYTKLAILNILPFEDRLPVKYLGVPLNKSLSIAGRLQLIKSVLSSLHVYWASVFMLPSHVLLDIEQIMCGFLWSQDNMSKGKVKVAWDVVCLPKQEGGLVFVGLTILTKLLWCRMFGSFFLLRSLYGLSGFMFISLRIEAFGISRIVVRCHGAGGTSCFSDLLFENLFGRVLVMVERILCGLTSGVLWVLYPTSFHLVTLLELVLTMLPSDDNSDSLEWRCRDGRGKPFSVHNVWDLIRLRDNLVSWCDLVWFHACIPRHAFNMWLIFKQRLRTQDRLRSWEVNSDLVIAGLTGAGPSLASIITHLMPIAKRKSSKSCIGKLVVAAAAYFIWHA